MARRRSADTVERFYKLAEEREVPLCELLELALDALEGRGGDAGWNCLLGLRKSSTFFLNRWDGKSHANNAESDT